MKTMYLIREIYLEGFRDLGNYLVTHFFKIFAWFSFIMYLLVVYAFLYRLSTGFRF